MTLAHDITTRAQAAHDRIRDHVAVTPIIDDPRLSAATGAQVDLKCEHRQITGSFKLRGALAKISALSADERARGIVTASSGNHGIAVATALRQLGGSGVVCVPESVAPVKAAHIEQTGTPLRRLGETGGETERLAAALADEQGLTYVSPYDDPDVVAGQATVGLEVIDQAPRPYDVVVVAVGGGGLITGVAATLKDAWPDITVVGAQPAADAAMAWSVERGEIVDLPAEATLSDGTAGAVAPGAHTFDTCRALVDRWVLVDEPSIARAMAHHIDSHHETVEGSAGVALAGVEQVGAASDAGGRGAPLAGARVLVVSCGANIGASRLRDALTLALA